MRTVLRSRATTSRPSSARLRYCHRIRERATRPVLSAVMRPHLAQLLDLEPHPEGGWYRQTWRSAVSLSPPGYEGSRATATAIYFLLNPGEASRWHRVASDELWLWHAGGPLTLTLGGAG